MTTLTAHPARLGLAVAAALLCLLPAGCGSKSDSGASAPSVGSDSASPSAAAKAIDACALISPEDITSLLGKPTEGKSTSTDPEMPACIWEDPTTYESVTLEIGNPDTAINGTLPPEPDGMPELTKPGPDGMRFIGTGSVEFAADKRRNTLQVAVLRLLGQAADDAAVDLARKVTAQLNG